MSFEVLSWYDASTTKPDSDITVICWLAAGEWFAGWWDDQDQRWHDCSHGGPLNGVTHWSEPVGPDA
jgi:hypothetical protein